MFILYFRSKKIWNYVYKYEKHKQWNLLLSPNIVNLNCPDYSVRWLFGRENGFHTNNSNIVYAVAKGSKLTILQEKTIALFDRKRHVFPEQFPDYSQKWLFRSGKDCIRPSRNNSINSNVVYIQVKVCLKSQNHNLRKQSCKKKRLH